MLVELREVSKYYEQPGTTIKNRVLDQVSFTIRESEAISVIGPSGSGKSTLLNILGTLDHPSSGTVIINGCEVNSLDQNALADIRNRFIGYVFQLHYLLPQLTLLENALLPVLARKDKPDQDDFRRRALQLIEMVGLKDQIHKFPYQLSAGECQRGAVVRALINKPLLLLADEPTGSLDAENAELLGQLLVTLNREQQVAMVVVTHSIDLANKMSTNYRLGSGKLLQLK